MPQNEPGLYRVRIVGQRFGTTTNNCDYLALAIEPIQSLGSQSMAGSYEREITLYLTSKAVPFSVEKLRSLGWTGRQFSQLEPASPSFHSFAGIEVEAQCEINEKGYEDWSLQQESRESDPGVAARLDAKHSKVLAASAAAKPAAAAATAAPPAAVTDGPIPF